MTRRPVDSNRSKLRFGRRRTDSGLHLLTLAYVEAAHIEWVLSHCAGNVTHAADVLGLHRRTLQRKLAQLRRARSR